MKSILQELKSHYTDYKHIYTDGSKDDMNFGCALVSDDSLKLRIPDGSSIFTAKAKAIDLVLDLIADCETSMKGALAWYGKLTWESAHAWILKILCYLIVWGMTLIFMVRLSFYAIPLLIYDVMNDITIIP